MFCSLYWLQHTSEETEDLTIGYYTSIDSIFLEYANILPEENSVFPEVLGQYAIFYTVNRFAYSQQMQSIFVLLLAIKSVLMKSVLPGFEKN